MHTVITYCSAGELFFPFLRCVLWGRLLLNVKPNKLQRQKRIESGSVGTDSERFSYGYWNNQTSVAERDQV